MIIEKYLLDKGIKPNHKGFKQLTYAIELCQKDETYLDGFTKRLYPDIARDFNITHSNVERDLRFAIRSAGHNVVVSEFIARAVLELRITKPSKGRKNYGN